MLVFFCSWMFVSCSWNVLVFQEVLFTIWVQDMLSALIRLVCFWSGRGRGVVSSDIYVVLVTFNGGGGIFYIHGVEVCFFTVPTMNNLGSLYAVLLVCLCYGCIIHSLWWGSRLVYVCITLIILIWLVHAINIYIINKVFNMHCSIYLNLWYDYTLVIMDG